MIFRFEVDTANAAFDGSMADVAIELRRLFKEATGKMAFLAESEGNVLDLNGNTVGTWSYESA